MKKYFMLLVAVCFTSACMAQSNARTDKKPQKASRIMAEQYCEEMRDKRKAPTAHKPKTVVKHKRG